MKLETMDATTLTTTSGSAAICLMINELVFCEGTMLQDLFEFTKFISFLFYKLRSDSLHLKL
jgi:hypothetical protein